MTQFTIVEGRAHHCGQMARTLRREHKRVVEKIGVNIHRELRQRFDASLMRKAWLVDGKLAALGGVVATSLSFGGYVWLAVSELALDYPIALVKEARSQLDNIMTVKRELATVIIPEDESALRLAVFLGFHVADQGLGSPAHTRMERHALRRFLQAAHEIRIPMGNGQVIPVGYHHDEAA